MIENVTAKKLGKVILDGVDYISLEFIDSVLEGLKDLYPYSNNNETYNKVIDLCASHIRQAAESIIATP